MRDRVSSEQRSREPRLIILCGLPGSGKTTRAQALEAGLQAVRFSPDEWMQVLAVDLYDEARRAKIEALQWMLGQRLLTLGLTVIIEWGTWGKSERDTLRLQARELGAAVELHYRYAPEDILFERIQRRGLENPPIERQALFDWFNTFKRLHRRRWPYMTSLNELLLNDQASSPMKATSENAVYVARRLEELKNEVYCCFTSA